MEKKVKIVTITTSILSLLILAIVSVSLTKIYKYHNKIAESSGGVRWNGSADVAIPRSANLAGEAMPIERVDVYEALSRELITNTYLHSHTIQLIKKAPRFFKTIEPILREEGVPDDFKYLAVIESQLNPRAISHAGAVGLWQFMKGTATDFGLEVNGEVDERYNIEKSTRAACAYLKMAYKRFGSWTLAAASYNGGMRRVTLQQESQKQTSFYDLLFAEETTRYIYRFVALKEIMSNPTAYNFYIDQHYAFEQTKEVIISDKVDNLTTFAKSHNISYKVLKDFNPWLRDNQLINRTGKSYKILIPTNINLY